MRRRLEATRPPARIGAAINSSIASLKKNDGEGEERGAGQRVDRAAIEHEHAAPAATLRHPGRARFISSTPKVESSDSGPAEQRRAPRRRTRGRRPRRTPSRACAAPPTARTTRPGTPRPARRSRAAASTRPRSAQREEAGRTAPGRRTPRASPTASAAENGRLNAKRDQAVSAGDTCPTSRRESALRPRLQRSPRRPSAGTHSGTGLATPPPRHQRRVAACGPGARRCARRRAPRRVPFTNTCAMPAGGWCGSS